MYKLVKPTIDYKVRDLCFKPYYNHKKGCPNFNNRKTCPPIVKKLEDILNLNAPIYVIYNCFYLKKHIDKMRFKHPNWSQRQLECCLYWQNTARKQLQIEIDIFNLTSNGIYDKNFYVIKCPEACGVNITETMKQIGIWLEWPPKVYTYQIALAGILKQ